MCSTRSDLSHQLTLTVLQTGFSQGEPSISNDDELAAQLQGFFEQFLEVFSELKGSNFFVSGESVSVVKLRQLSKYLSNTGACPLVSTQGTVSITRK